MYNFVISFSFFIAPTIWRISPVIFKEYHFIVKDTLCMSQVDVKFLQIGHMQQIYFSIEYRVIYKINVQNDEP